MRRWLGLWLGVTWSVSAGAMQVLAGGAVAHPGVLNLPAGARLSAAALAAQPAAAAYLLGAAWLRPSLRGQQARQQAGVLFDLATLRQRAQADRDSALASTALAMRHWLASLPVTGRQAPAVLDPRVVEATPAQNHLLADGDQLIYPVRPATIRVVGAVQQPCTLPLVALQDARRYLAACPGNAAADADDIYVIQPDGRVFKQGIALWNRAAPMPLAPGAMIYVPLRQRAAAKVDAELNPDIAALLATQVLPGPEAH